MSRISITVCVVVIVSTFSLMSCGSGVGVRKTNVRYWNGSESGIVSNESFQVKRKGYEERSLLELFKIREDSIDSVSFAFTDSTTLVLQYSCGDGQRVEKSFNGRFKRRGYFEYYRSKMRIEIPPVFPILFSKVHINRLRLALTPEGHLIVDNKWNRSGNIFILSGGAADRHQNFFHRKQHAGSSL